MVKQTTYHLCDVIKYHLWVARASGAFSESYHGRRQRFGSTLAAAATSFERRGSGALLSNVSCTSCFLPVCTFETGE